MKFGDKVRVVNVGNGHKLGRVIAINDPNVTVALERSGGRIIVSRRDLRIVSKGK